ncbi:hypothetical protein GRF59_09550 [Paenibacillus sp. HJL G12]|uniref:Large ribosomal subunit protein bL12 C-terminal domain-containing protein n=1 Tax=Paenibacillus dendrobii TaxID=2691084 RepID=A0A7X3LI34_9BACL|nr:ribosomal protein L7/L12 [Paenibacillus dendrobii]MWV43879.1 hypothetical protein [Paenibacillus dendrobii]
METSEILAVIAIVISLFLFIRVISLQSQMNNIKADLEWMRNRAGSQSVPVPAATSPTPSGGQETADSALDERLLFLLQSGQKIKAIKEIREVRSLGLKEAKEYVEALERNV